MYPSTRELLYRVEDCPRITKVKTELLHTVMSCSTVLGSVTCVIAERGLRHKASLTHQAEDVEDNLLNRDSVAFFHGHARDEQHQHYPDNLQMESNRTIAMLVVHVECTSSGLPIWLMPNECKACWTSVNTPDLKLSAEGDRFGNKNEYRGTYLPSIS